MRVVHTVASLAESQGGPTRTIPALCARLASLGVEIDILTGDPGPDPGSSQLSVDAGVRTRTVPGRGSAGLGELLSGRFRSRLLETCCEREIELIHDHGMWLGTNHAAASVAKAQRIPRVVSPRGMLTPWALSHHRWKKRLVWKVFAGADTRRADLLHATSEQEANELRELGFGQPITVIPNGVDLPAWVEPHRKDDRPRLALFLSRIHPKKGLPNLIDAWSRLQPAGWTLLIVGPDELGHRAELEAQIERHGLSDAVGFQGSTDHDEKWELYRRADLFVLPTHSENFGVVVAEALACGVPVVTTRGAPWAELESERCGWWIDIGVDPLADALEEAFSQKDETLHAMGLRGRQLVERRYGWPSIATRMRDTYAWLLGSGERPGVVRLD